MVNSVNPDYTADKEQSDLGLHYFFKSICQTLKDSYGMHK